MLLKYYGLRKQPFGVTPDARSLYESDTHREALASLLYGIEVGRGFSALIAEPGMGKTTLLLRTLETLRGRAKTVFLFQTMSTPLDFLRMLLSDLHVLGLKENLFELQSKLNDLLLGYSIRGERLVVVIDEAQNLEDSVLEFLRMLSNFETPQGKLMEIILSGQPKLARKLASADLVQLRQRISIVARLQPFSEEESENYIDHRLRLAGYESDSPLFTSAALRLIAQHSGGNPRNINNLCFNSMSLGCAHRRTTIDADIVQQVISDLDLGSLGEKRSLESDAAKAAPVTAASRATVGTWVQRLAIASAALLFVAGTSISDDSRATVLANDGQPKDIKTEAVVLRPAEVAQPTAKVTVAINSNAMSSVEPSKDLQVEVIVPDGTTLYQLCAKTLGTCHSKELWEIFRLNPWLTAPDHLEAGRILRLPSANVLSAGVSEPANLISSKPSTEEAAK